MPQMIPNTRNLKLCVPSDKKDELPFMWGEMGWSKHIQFDIIGWEIFSDSLGGGLTPQFLITEGAFKNQARDMSVLVKAFPDLDWERARIMTPLVS